MTGGYFYYGPDNFLTSRSYPAGYGCAVGGYLCEGDSFVRDTGRELCKPAVKIASSRQPALKINAAKLPSKSIFMTIGLLTHSKH